MKERKTDITETLWSDYWDIIVSKDLEKYRRILKKLKIVRVVMLCFQIPERQYIWTALSARAKAHAWADIENLLTAKVNLYWLIYLIINIVTLQMKKKYN